ncbi:MAG: hypothetical protein J0L93_05715 [Deltaproteobacteria bacterium]|nr:hypothetical protein [Deltaproteobacteria bacterium]
MGKGWGNLFYILILSLSASTSAIAKDSSALDPYRYFHLIPLDTSKLESSSTLQVLKNSGFVNTTHLLNQFSLARSSFLESAKALHEGLPPDVKVRALVEIATSLRSAQTEGLRIEFFLSSKSNPQKVPSISEVHSYDLSGIETHVLRKIPSTSRTISHGSCAQIASRTHSTQNLPGMFP